MLYIEYVINQICYISISEDNVTPEPKTLVDGRVSFKQVANPHISFHICPA